MRILITADPEIPVPPKHYGGIERIISSLSRELVDIGHTVGLVANRQSDVYPAILYPWTETCSGGLVRSLKNSLLLRRVVSDFRPDIVHSFSRLAYLSLLAADRIPKVMSYQREPTGKTIRLANMLHGKRITFTGCSHYISEAGRKAGGGTWTTIHNFVDLGTYTYNSAISRESPLVFLSRIEPTKGAHMAIEIAKRSGRRLLIAGNYATSGPNGDYWTNVIKPQLCDQIEYVGTVNDSQKNRLLGAASAMIVPIQWNEPFGIVFAESLACGTPVISCPTGALPEIVENGVHGFLISDVESGAESVSKLDSISRQACRKQVEEKFSADAIVTQYVHLYEKCIAQ